MISMMYFIVVFMLIGVHKTVVDAVVSINAKQETYGVGKSLTVTCTLTGETFEYWKHETTNQILSVGSNYDGKLVVTVSGNEVELQFNDIDEKVAGNFTCVGSENTESYILYIELDFETGTCDENQGLVFGTNDEIGCVVRGYPTPTMEWTKNISGSYKKITDSRISLKPTGALEVRNVREDDAGSYRLSIAQEKTRRSTTRDFSIQIYHPVKIDREANPRVVYSYIGNKEPIKLSCNASGFPVPKIEFTKDEVNVDYFFDKIVSDIEGFYSVELTTNNLEKFGAYAWTASNVVNTDVLGVLLDQAEEPRLVYANKNIVGVLYKETKLKCKLTGKPYPSVKWYRNGKLLNDSKKYRFQINEDSEDALLVITDTRESDIGEYVCFAANMMGNTTGKPYITSVEKEQKITPQARTRRSRTGMLVGIIVAVILVVIICLDLFCCFFNNCGISFCLVETFCTKHTSSSKATDDPKKKPDKNENVDEKLLKTSNEKAPVENV